MKYVDNFFKRARPDEELYECYNDFTSIDRLAQSFLYHVKGNELSDTSCATDEQRARYKRLVMRSADPIEVIELTKMMPAQAAIKELEHYKS
ncbi:TPA: hypothetical protein ACMDRT_001574 [Vibrio parahaemolyticus]|uniref:hypothetical protein n=1 Tax=Vibrio alginolyticus TaxID=663 RepID=UPI00384BC143